MKKCPRCGIEKSREEFYKKSCSENRLQSYCKSCCKEKAVLWQKANPEKRRKSARKDYLAHSEMRREAARRRREANPEYQRDRRRATREQAIATLGGCCSRCGAVENDPDCWKKLHFHHVDPNTKSFSIASKFTQRWDVVKDEVAKCVLLCWGCHIFVHRCLNAGVPVKPYTRKKRKVREVA